MKLSGATLWRVMRICVLTGAAVSSAAASAADPQSDKGLSQQIFETMIQVPGANPAFRTAHAKGIVCEGTFTPSKDASSLSKAAHFQGGSVPLTVRFSDASPDPFIPDNSPNVGPRGMAIRFNLSGGGATDMVLLSHNGFIVGTPEDFLAVQKAIVATDPSKPHPWPIEAFIGSHPLAAKFVQEVQATPASYGTAAFFSNDAFIFVNNHGQ